MTKEELKQAELSVINEFGPPEWDGFRGPSNESAIRIDKLRKTVMRENRQNQVKLRKSMILAKNQPENAVNLGAEEAAFVLPAALDADFLLFSSDEQAIILAYFKSWNKTASDIAMKACQKVDKVSRFLNTDKWRTFFSKTLIALKDDLHYPTHLALKRLLSSKDEKVVLEVTKLLGYDSGYLRKNPATEGEKEPQPELTPEMWAKLKELGDAGV